MLYFPTVSSSDSNEAWITLLLQAICLHFSQFGLAEKNPIYLLHITDLATYTHKSHYRWVFKFSVWELCQATLYPLISRTTFESLQNSNNFDDSLKTVNDKRGIVRNGVHKFCFVYLCIFYLMCIFMASINTQRLYMYRMFKQHVHLLLYLLFRVFQGEPTAGQISVVC